MKARRSDRRTAGRKGSGKKSLLTAHVSSGYSNCMHVRASPALSLASLPFEWLGPPESYAFFNILNYVVFQWYLYFNCTFAHYGAIHF